MKLFLTVAAFFIGIDIFFCVTVQAAPRIVSDSYDERKFLNGQITSHTRVLGYVCCEDTKRFKNFDSKQGVIDIVIRLNKNESISLMEWNESKFRPYTCETKGCSKEPILMYAIPSLENPLKGLNIRFYCGGTFAPFDLESKEGAYAPIIVNKGSPEVDKIESPEEKIMCNQPNVDIADSNKNKQDLKKTSGLSHQKNQNAKKKSAGSSIDNQQFVELVEEVR